MDHNFDNRRRALGFRVQGFMGDAGHLEGK